MKMEGVLIELFTSRSCPYCPAARQVAEGAIAISESALLIERDIDEPESGARAMELGVTNVPTLVINGKYKIVGAPRSVEELAQMIDQSQRG